MLFVCQVFHFWPPPPPHLFPVFPPRFPFCIIYANWACISADRGILTSNWMRGGYVRHLIFTPNVYGDHIGLISLKSNPLIEQELPAAEPTHFWDSRSVFNFLELLESSKKAVCSFREFPSFFLTHQWPESGSFQIASPSFWVARSGASKGWNRIKRLGHFQRSSAQSVVEISYDSVVRVPFRWTDCCQLVKKNINN